MSYNFPVIFLRYPTGTNTGTEANLSIETRFTLIWQAFIAIREKFPRNLESLFQLFTMWKWSIITGTTGHQHFGKILFGHSHVVITLVIFLFGVVDWLAFLYLICF